MRTMVVEVVQLLSQSRVCSPSSRSNGGYAGTSSIPHPHAQRGVCSEFVTKDRTGVHYTKCGRATFQVSDCLHRRPLLCSEISLISFDGTIFTHISLKNDCTKGSSVRRNGQKALQETGQIALQFTLLIVHSTLLGITHMTRLYSIVAI
jgi:hypothetical protein